MKTSGRPLLSACTAILAFTAFTAFTAFASATTWANTATKGISLSQLISAGDLGPLSASTPLTVRLGLQVQNKTALLSFVKAVSTPGNPLYGEYLTPQQFTAKYAPSSAQVEAVTAYLESAGFYDIVVKPSNLMISAIGIAAQASAAFHTRLEEF